MTSSNQAAEARFNHQSAIRAAEALVRALRRERLYRVLAPAFHLNPRTSGVGKADNADLAAQERALLRFLRAPYDAGSLRHIVNPSDRRAVLCAGCSAIPAGAPTTGTGWLAASDIASAHQYGYATA
jgi:hypothetical protein